MYKGNKEWAERFQPFDSAKSLAQDDGYRVQVEAGSRGQCALGGKATRHCGSSAGNALVMLVRLLPAPSPTPYALCPMPYAL